MKRASIHTQTRAKDRGAPRHGAMAAVLAVSLAAALSPAWGAQPAAPARTEEELSRMALEDLLNIPVTLASRKEQPLHDTAAAVYVLTADDIRRSGVATVPEALRMVPGMQVGQVDANKWAITARGFNSRFANKLLVLVDSRSIYAPAFAGVEWETQDLILEDIERIEVIRGPGAALWGANAVNGVVNIITRKARDTHGGLLSASGGAEDQGIGEVRYGGRVGEQAHYRVHARYFERDSFAAGTGDAADGWDTTRGGFRLDWEPSGSDSLTLAGETYNDNLRQTTTLPILTIPYSQTFDEQYRLRGTHARGRWEHRLAGGSRLALQGYVDRTERQLSLNSEFRDTYDLDFQHRLEVGTRREIVWGGGYRYTADRIGNTFAVSFDPERRGTGLASAFVELLNRSSSGRWSASLGSKFEHNDYTGFEVQPSARLLLKLSGRQSLWGAISRAVRTPSRAEADADVNYQVFDPGGGTPLVVRSVKNEDFGSEELLAYELGYRILATHHLSFDAAAFYNQYDDLFTRRSQAIFSESSPLPVHDVLPNVKSNEGRGETLGAEVAFNWKPSRRWSLAGWYSWLQFEPESKQSGATVVYERGHNPRHQAHLRSFLDLPRGFAFDLSAYFMDRLESLDVPSYLRLDARLAWRLQQRLEVSVGVRNLLDDRHYEFARGQAFETPSEVERSVYGKTVWRF